MQHCLTNGNGGIMISSDDGDQSIICFQEKTKNGHMYLPHKLSDIDEEDDKFDEDYNYQIFYPGVKLFGDRNIESKELSESTETPSNLPKEIQTEILDDNATNERQTLRIEHLFETYNLKRILNNGNSRQNKSLPTKLLCKKATLSSMIDIQTNSESQSRYRQSQLFPNTPQYRSNSLASSQIELTLSTSKDSVIFGKMSSSSLSQSKSYFNCSNISASSINLLTKVHKSHKLNPLIVQTKNRISLLENTELHRLEPCAIFNNPRNSQLTSRFKSQEKSMKKCPSSSKFFNQNFKLNFSDS